MKTVLLILLSIFSLDTFSQVRSYDYAYSNSKGICVYSNTNKQEVLVEKHGDNPCISPDGTKLAYTVLAKNGDRTIGVIDLGTKQKMLLNTGSNNCYGPVWSPDGKWIAYNVFVDQKNWCIAIISSSNGSPKVLTGSLEQCYMPTWTADSKEVVVQNMDKVIVFDQAGNVTTSYKISDITNTDGPGSSDRFIFTVDRNRVVFSSEVNEPGFNDGPPSAVFVYDIANKTTVRLTPKGYYAADIWVKGSKVLFSGGKIKATVINVYTVDLDGKNLKLMFANCSNISAKQ